MLRQFTSPKPYPVLCFSHLRWNFVYQRPQHLLSRCHKYGEVHFWEEPTYERTDSARLQIEDDPQGVRVLTPILPEDLDPLACANLQRTLLDEYLNREGIEDFVSWYYTPMALALSSHLEPCVTVYDCMDELSAFDGAPPEIIQMEKRLFARADVVFAGGASLYESKRRQHKNIHLFPSSIDRDHFMAARLPQPDPADQAQIPHPRIGFYGVLDERLDRGLLAEVAERNPGWHLILLGPVVKIAPSQLPQASNLHYLGQKKYSDLPQYMANWDVAMLPFAQNASTRFISPTKTPEYLAAGKPVVSTPIRDVVRPYGERGLVEISDNAESFSTAIQTCLDRRDDKWLRSVDQFIDTMSWDRTFDGMWNEILKSMQTKSTLTDKSTSTERGGSYV